jgi:GNAT superfamily N-acetyltransferase
LEVDEDHDVAAAVEAAAGIAGARFELWVDDRDRDRVVGSALASLGWQPVRTTTFLALVGPVAAAPGPPDLQITAVDPDEGDHLTTWASVKLRGFAESDDPPAPDVLEAEADQWRGEAVLARYDLAWLLGEPVGVLGRYAGSDQLVFNLAVRPPWRRRGIGQALLGRWVAQGEHEGCRSLLINANDGGPAAALYRAMGFVDEVHWQRCYER